jgi:hypothetical protein
VLNSKSQAKSDVLTTERHNSVKENDKLRVVCQTSADEKARMKNDNQTRLEERQRLISMNTRLLTDRPTCQNSSRYWQSDADTLRGNVDRMASENERLCSVTQQLMEGNALFGTIYKLHRKSWIWPWPGWVTLRMN